MRRHQARQAAADLGLQAWLQTLEEQICRIGGATTGTKILFAKWGKNPLVLPASLKYPSAWGLHLCSAVLNQTGLFPAEKHP